MQRLTNIRTTLLIVAGLALALFLSVVAARTDVIAIVDTGDGNDTALVASLALLDASGTTPVIPVGTDDNYAVAINTEDGTTLAETAFLITYAASGIVNQTNAAIAYSSCDFCRTFAAAIEVVLVPAQRADIVTPTNLAVAVNEDCLSCETAAFATQIVLGVDGPVAFTEEGNEELEQIQEDLQQLEEDADELTLEEFQARYDEIVARLWEVLNNELVPIWEANRQNKNVEDTTIEETTSQPEGTTFEPEGTTPESEGTTSEATGGTEPEETSPTATEEPLPEQTTPEQTTSTSPQPTESEQTVLQPGGATTSSASPTPEETAPASPAPEESAPASPTPGGSTTTP